MWSRSRLARSRTNAQGAVVVYVAFFIGVLIAAVTMSIDIGRLYNAQRELQRAANLAALDATRMTNGCMGHVEDDEALTVAQGEALDSLQRNTMPTSYLPANGVALGRLISTGGIRTFQPLDAADAGERTAVQVRLERPTPTRLLPLPQDGTMVATAAADSRPVVAFSVGSGLASVNGGLANSLLGGLIGGSLSLNALSYQGLANANVRLGDLALAADAGTVDDYLAAETSLDEAFDNILNAVGSGQGGTVQSALTQLANAASAGKNVTPGNVILTAAGLDGDYDNAMINVGQLVMALAQSANGTNAVNLPLAVNIPGVASVTARIVLVEAPKIAVARAGDQDTFASTAQGQIDLDLTLVGGVVHLPLAIRLAKATASLDEVQCARSGQPKHEVAIDTSTSIATVGIGTFGSSIDSPTPTISRGTIVNVLNLVKAELSLLVDVGGAQTDALDFESPFPTAVQSVGTDTSAALDNALSGVSQANLQVTVLGANPLGILNGLINTTLSSAMAVLTPVLGNITDTLIEPLLNVLGVSLGTADVQVVSLVPVDRNDAVVAAQPSLQAFLFTH